ncbi:MAG: glycosyltransferase family 4 protein [Muribaculaceae bacterium]|nr:glycosyltransferase family 4 protein [Muribaculaceae bacterium]
MRITWVTRSFLDYRVPVYKALDELCGHQLTLIYNADIIPERCSKKVTEILGDRAIGLRGEIKIKSKNLTNEQLANVGYSFPYHKDLIRLARKSKPDVIVSDGFLKWTYAPLWIRLFNRRVKHVMCYERTFHTERNAGWLRTTYRKLAGRLIDAIDCNGIQTIEYVRKGLNYKKLLTVGHMVADTTGMAANVEFASDNIVNNLISKYELRDLTYIYVGRLIPLKGIMELLRAWKEAKLQSATLLLVGDGSQREKIETFIKENGLNDSVKLTGAINYDNLGPYYKAADCFIIPTLEDNWSLVVPEAMAAGLPIACSIYNGCHPELVHPENGWTFDPLDVENTVKTLKSISESRDRLKQMGNESRKIVANHTPQHAAQGIYDACLKVLKK